MSVYVHPKAVIDPQNSMGRQDHKCFNKNLYVKLAGFLSAYGLLWLPDINQLTQLTVCNAYKVNKCLQTFEKKTCSIFTVFILGYLSTAILIFFFLADFLIVFFLGKDISYCHMLVLNLPQYKLTFIAYTNNIKNLIPVPDKK